MKNGKPKKITFLSNEKWKPLVISKESRKSYAISTHGRIISYEDKIQEGSLLKTRLTQRYPSISFRGPEGKNLNFYIHRLVAQTFLSKKSPKHKYVIHLDHVKENNKVGNLKWVTLSEQIEHAKKDPIVLAQKKPTEGPKLNADKVRQIKIQLKTGKNKTLKAIARKFRVSDMQIFRIKSGENWSHIKA